jgi:hypothetical protein
MLDAPTMECDRINLRRSVPVQKRQKIFKTVPVRHSGGAPALNVPALGQSVRSKAGSLVAMACSFAGLRQRRLVNHSQSWKGCTLCQISSKFKTLPDARRPISDGAIHWPVADEAICETGDVGGPEVDDRFGFTARSPARISWNSGLRNRWHPLDVGA